MERHFDEEFTRVPESKKYFVRQATPVSDIWPNVLTLPQPI